MRNLAFATFSLFAFLLVGCIAQQPLQVVQLSKQGASYQDFSRDRYACVQEASRPVSSGYANAYGASTSSNVIPSQGVYLSCMNARGWYRVSQGGFVPDTPIRMIQ